MQGNLRVGFGKGRLRKILVVYFHHYTPNIELAFNSVEYIMRDVPNGWLIRYIHANGASMCAGKMRCRVFLTKAHRLALFFCSSFPGSLLRLFSVMLRYE